MYKDIKKIIVLVLCIFFVIGLLTGCGSKSEEPKSQPEAEVPVKQELVVGEQWFPSTMDPAEGWNGWYTIKYGLGETLVKANDKMEIVPWIADSWKQLDELTWEIKIKDGVTFSTGEKLTGEAVKASIDRAIEINATAAGLLDIDHIEAADNGIIIKTNDPNPALIANLASPSVTILDVNAGNFEEMPVLTGPFRLVKFDKDAELVVEKNENYWGKEPYLEKVTFKHIPDANTRVMALQAGEVNAALGLPAASLDIFMNSSDFEVLSRSTARTHMIIFNLKNPLFNDPAVRKAISMAVDRESIVDSIMMGMGVPGVGPFPLVMPFGGEQLKGYGYEPEKAKDMLEEAGWTLGSDGVFKKGSETLEFTLATYRGRPELPIIAEVVQAQLKDIGVKVNIEVIENISSYLGEKAFDTSIYSMNTATTGDPQYFLEIVFKTGASSNFGGYSNPALDAKIDELKTAYNMQDRYRIAKEAQQIILDDAGFIFLVYPMNVLVVDSSVKNMSTHPSDFYLLNESVRME
ncbi:ABC transporter substrate-binding protein [Desulfitibacter alkalitolerans]|uniref:ABC transporter substrate-binding protein n=1 Tax=Desulfitibacter alkalitolerans TaxID=264641 RepID=UPI000486BB91|nr:ABC transporter substrate-binding protein [Desulfitibacter alkalitolerans]